MFFLKLQVAGWGKLHPCSTSLVDVLREARMDIVSDAVCEAASGSYIALSKLDNLCTTFPGNYSGLISEDMICAGSAGKGSCQGDSGGPFTVKEGEQHSLVGVTSGGFGCASVSLSLFQLFQTCPG